MKELKNRSNYFKSSWVPRHQSPFILAALSTSSSYHPFSSLLPGLYFVSFPSAYHPQLHPFSCQIHQPIIINNFALERTPLVTPIKHLVTFPFFGAFIPVILKLLHANIIAKGYNLNLRYAFHMDTPSHDTIDCWGLKHKVYDLIDNGTIAISPPIGTST